MLVNTHLQIKYSSASSFLSRNNLNLASEVKLKLNPPKTPTLVCRNLPSDIGKATSWYTTGEGCSCSFLT